MSGTEVKRSIDAVWRIESTRLIAGLARFTGGDLDLAEDLAQEALVAALETWPGGGIPDNPGAWLFTTARNRGLDRFRRDRNLSEKYQQVGREAVITGADIQPGPDQRAGDVIGDDVLSLIFTTCHPVLSADARVALTLKLLGGLSTDEISRAYLTPKATVAQRIVRAKRTLTEARVPFELPERDELEGRLGSVLGVIYLIFNEGYSATAGDDWMRPGLTEEALRLGRILQGLMPSQPEVHGLAALMEIQASRSKARVGDDGLPVLLLEQDRSRWDFLLIGRGFEALGRAQALGGPYGPYTLQAAIAACHARARRAEDTAWHQITALYDALGQIRPSPVVELNRAVAVSMAYGPEAALEVVERLDREGELDGYHLLPAVRADLLVKLGRFEQARDEFERAAGMTANRAERALLLARAGECGA